MRNRVERFFRYLKERTMVFHHNLSARNHIQGINKLNPIHNILPGRERKRWVKMLIRTLPSRLWKSL
jgi:hypothetical protein